MADNSIPTITSENHPSRRALIAGAVAAVPVAALATPALSRTDERLQLIFELQKVLKAECAAYAQEQNANRWSFQACEKYPSRIDLFREYGPERIKPFGDSMVNFGRDMVVMAGDGPMTKREELEAVVEHCIDLLNLLDGDENLECNGDPEPDHEGEPGAEDEESWQAA